MEMSHRSKVYDNIIKTAEADLREIMNIPDNYKVLFLQGGASQQFAMIPMNLMKNRKAGYIVTGQWAKKAYQEAKIYGDAVAVASSADKTFSYIPDCSDLDIPEDADYVYICENNTIYGTKFKTLPNTKGHTLVADVSSCFLSEPVDVHNEKKAKILYDFLDQSKLFKGTVEPKDRSLMNVPFVTGNEELDAKFVKEATAAGFVNLKGHRTVGGMRASIYNAMPIEGVEKLVEFMKKFEAENG